MFGPGRSSRQTPTMPRLITAAPDNHHAMPDGHQIVPSGHHATPNVHFSTLDDRHTAPDDCRNGRPPSLANRPRLAQEGRKSALKYMYEYMKMLCESSWNQS